MSVKLGVPTSRLLDVARGVAALLVVAGHSREYAAQIYNLNPRGTSLFETILLGPSSFAMESVAVFFVLSGFLVGGQIIRDLQNNKFYWSVFVAKRLSRLWTVLVPGIIFTWLLWDVAIERFGHEGFGSSPSFNSGVCNILFLQETWCQPFANNAALWSLSYEFWFYIVFAGISIAIVDVSRQRFARALLNLSLVVCSVAVFGLKLFLLIPAWVIGAAVSWKFGSSSGIRLMMAKHAYLWLSASIVSISLFAVISNLLNMNRVVLTAFISIPSALFVMAALSVDKEVEALRRLVDVGVRLGHWSFSIYVFHIPILIAVLYGFKNATFEGVSLPTLTYLAVLTTIPITLVLWWLTERKTDLVRDFALKLFPNFDK